MTIWTPALTSGTSPTYRALADAIEEAIRVGALAPGDRLPTHRALAENLGVNVGTVSRGYAEAGRRGLTVGEVGRGTFVRGSERPGLGSWAESRDDGRDIIDLSLSLPPELPGDREGQLLSDTLRAIASDRATGQLLRYRQDSGHPWHREAAAAWMLRGGLEADPGNLVVTAGAQHALGVLFNTLLHPGETILMGDVTYPGAKAAATVAGLTIRGIPLDREGLLPDAVERACWSEDRPSALYLVPTIQNPTGGVLSRGRREALAEIAERWDLLVVEDDVHALLPEEPVPPPVSALVPERSYYVMSLTKSLAMGLRTGFVAVPEKDVERVRAGLRSSLWMSAPLMAEVSARWMSGDVGPDLVEAKRQESAARQRLAADILGGHEVRAHPFSYYLWLPLPEPLRSDEVVAQAARRGVRVAGAEAFAVGRNIPPAIRVALGAGDHDTLRRGLMIVDDILGGRPERCAPVL